MNLRWKSREQTSPDSRGPIWLLAVLAALPAIALYVLEAHRGFILADEGYTWYGAQRTLMGEVPGLQFQSYDIGRYYWAAAVMALRGNDGLVALRASALAFEAVCLLIGLVTLYRSARQVSWCYWLVLALALAAWMSPLYRIFDIAVPLLAFAALARLLERPGQATYVGTGIVVGLMAVIGRNHGVYAVVASACALSYVAVARRDAMGAVNGGLVWLLGVVIGYLPMLGLVAFVPGFTAKFVASVLMLGEIHTTNIYLKPPWPWAIDLHGLSAFWALEHLLTGTWFVAILAATAAGVVWVSARGLQGRPVSPAVAAGAFVSLPYLHIAFSRADQLHLATSIVPVLVGLFAWAATLSGRARGVVVALVGGTAIVSAVPLHLYWPQHSAAWVERTVGGDRLMVSPDTAQTVDALRQAVADHAASGEAIAAIPAIPGVYAMFHRKSPLWELYPVFPRTHAFQEGEVRRLDAARPALVVDFDFPIDGRDDLRYDRTHALLAAYFQAHYRPLTGYQLPYPYRLLSRAH